MAQGVQQGFFDFEWEDSTGKIWLAIDDQLDQEFLYVNALSAGVGSNDLGLDRNQLGDDHVVKFVRSGPKILLVQSNYDFRAVSDNPREREAVREAFARSVLWGFKREERNGTGYIDFTPFLLRDAHNVAGRLEQSNQGAYKVDASRSAIHLPRTKNFPDNTEFDALITLTGKPKGGFIRSVTPSPDAVTVHMHHSLIRLPDDQYTPRRNDPRSGYFGISYYDYATPIDQPLEKRYIVRHRLEKKDPSAAVSEAVEPIIYYLDPGCPEPIRSALIEGASWWNQAFEAAGYRNAFQVRVLPDDADPMDVRYNVINWVHRSTRGWSYGSSIVDPRTGEILKGHVLLGSLRVRQDFMIAQGLASIFENGDEDPGSLTDLALARLRQLSAHEVGHTLGLAHNFAASYNDRASVMDYPHPYVKLTNGQIDFSEAYDTGIGEWDKRAIIYGYQDFPDGTDEEAALRAILMETQGMGLRYISDQDARPSGGAHPVAHLWDNGDDPVAELERMSEVRRHALERFGTETIREGTPMAYLEQVLVPLYLGHRYQVEAVAKLIGGYAYTYAMRGDGQEPISPVPADHQMRAVESLLQTLSPEFLALDQEIVATIPPQPVGFGRHRELFKTWTAPVFDPLAAAESSVHHTLSFMLHPQRLARLHNVSAYEDGYPELSEYLDLIWERISGFAATGPVHRSLQQMVEKQMVHHLLKLAGDPSIARQVSAAALYKVSEIEAQKKLYFNANETKSGRAHDLYIISLFEDFSANRAAFKLPADTPMPPGSPIGCSGMEHLH